MTSVDGLLTVFAVSYFIAVDLGDRDYELCLTESLWNVLYSTQIKFD